METPVKTMSAPDTAPRCGQAFWDAFSRVYDALGSPLTPTPEDVRIMEDTVKAWADGHPAKSPRVLLLGVTPRIAGMRLPEGSSLMSIDRSIAMAQHIWPGNLPENRRVICGDWLSMPYRNSSYDVVIGDGIATGFRYQDGLRQLANSVRRVLQDDGVFLLRCFVRPEPSEDPEAVFAELYQSVSFHTFKFRLMMAMQRSVQEGILVHEVHQFWKDRNVDPELLFTRTGWPRRALETIDFHSGPNTVHTFPTLQELRALLADYFDEQSFTFPSYPLGDRCPILRLRPTRGSRS